MPFPPARPPAPGWGSPTSPAFRSKGLRRRKLKPYQGRTIKRKLTRRPVAR